MPGNKVCKIDDNREQWRIKKTNECYVNLKMFKCTGLLDVFRQYLKESTLHGFKYVGNPGITWLERSFFLTTIFVVFILSTYFISDNYNKWTRQPILMSVGSRSIAITEIPFSAVTICNVNQAQKSVASKIPKNSTRYYYLQNVCGVQSHSGYTNFTGEWQDYQQFLLEVTQSCKDMLKICTFGTIKYHCMELFASVLTDDGLCCTFNSVHKHFLIQPRHLHEKTSANNLIGTPVDWTPEFGYPPEVENTTNFYPRTAIGSGLSMGLWLILDADKNNYYCATTYCDGFKVLLHDPTEDPKVRDFGFAVKIGYETRAVVSASIVNSTQNIRNIPPTQRECVFADEVHLDFFRTYSRRNCQRECESKFVEKSCKCVHFAMPRTNPNIRICSQKSNGCYERSIRSFLQNQRHYCDFCLPSCSEISFTSSTSSSKLWISEHDMNQFNMTTEYINENIAVLGIYYKTSFVSPLIRDQYINFTTFVSNTGGLLGLALGFSVISLVEIVYFFVLQPCVDALRVRRNNKNHTK